MPSLHVYPNPLKISRFVEIHSLGTGVAVLVATLVSVVSSALLVSDAVYEEKTRRVKNVPLTSRAAVKYVGAGLAAATTLGLFAFLVSGWVWGERHWVDARYRAAIGDY